VRIGLLTTSFPRTESDIAGDFVLGFARQLAAQGHHVEVLAPEPSDAGDRWSEPPLLAARVANVTVKHVPYLRPRALQRTFYGAGVPDNLARDPLAWLGLAPFCASLYWHALRRARGWDVLISHWALPCALAAGAVRRSHQRQIAVLHSADVHALARIPLGARLAQRVVHGADALWFVSEEQRSRFLALLPRGMSLPPTLVCPMGIDLPRPSTSDAELRERYRREHGLRGYCVLLLGRLVHIKGLDVALEAAARGGMTLLIAGDGPLREPLGRRAQQLGAAVRFLGVVRGADKQALLQAADSFALPSRRLTSGRSEGLPCALLEALAAGLPVAASRLPGVAELLSQHALPHQLVPAEDPAALHRALLSLREEPAMRRARHPARQAVIARHGWPRIGERLAELLERVEVRS